MRGGMVERNPQVLNSCAALEMESIPMLISRVNSSSSYSLWIVTAAEQIARHTEEEEEEDKGTCWSADKERDREKLLNGNRQTFALFLMQI